MNQVLIFPRTDIEWAEMTPGLFRKQRLKGKPGAVIQYAIRSNVLGVWNNAFRMSYFNFRAKLQALVRDNWNAVEGATVAPPGKLPLPPGFKVVVPVDDDDFFSPDLAFHLVRTMTPLVHWWEAKLGAGSLNIDKRPNRYATNQYALRGEAIKPGWLYHHWFVHTLRGKTRNINRFLSLNNKTVASLGVLVPNRTSYFNFRAMTKPNRIGRLRGIAKKGTRVPEVPPGLEWAKPYIERVAELHQELLK
jgi:hypothetical protein